MAVTLNVSVPIVVGVPEMVTVDVPVPLIVRPGMEFWILVTVSV